MPAGHSEAVSVSAHQFGKSQHSPSISSKRHEPCITIIPCSDLRSDRKRCLMDNVVALRCETNDGTNDELILPSLPNPKRIPILASIIRHFAGRSWQHHKRKGGCRKGPDCSFPSNENARNGAHTILNRFGTEVMQRPQRAIQIAEWSHGTDPTRITNALIIQQDVSFMALNGNVTHLPCYHPLHSLLRTLFLVGCELHDHRNHTVHRSNRLYHPDFPIPFQRRYLSGPVFHSRLRISLHAAQRSSRVNIPYVEVVNEHFSSHNQVQ